MTAKMEMSLDDIIKQNKGNKRKGTAGGKRGAAAAGTGTRRTNGASPKRAPVRGGRKPGGGVMRGRNRGGISRSSGSSGFGRSLPSYKRDAFLGSNTSRRYGSSSDATKLIVSNLDFGVTDSDILELFSEFGPLKNAGVHYDRSGRSLGSADLIFERRADAIKAMKQYNGVPLDGREMNIQLATSEIPGVNPVRNNGTARLGSTFKARGSTNRNRGPRGAAKTRAAPKRKENKPARAKKETPTAEELDAQLEEYVKSKVSNSEGA